MWVLYEEESDALMSCVGVKGDMCSSIDQVNVSSQRSS